MKQKNITLIVAAAIAAMTAGTAAASGFQLLEQNASGLGNAYAGSAAVAEDASTIYFNPAGMTQLKQREFSLGGAAIKPSFKFTNNGSNVAPATNSGNGGDAGDWAVLPNAYLSWGVTKDIYLGLGLGAPFGLKTEYDDDWVGRYQATLFDIKTYNLNPSIAWRVNDKVSLGFGLNYQRMEATYERYAAVVNSATRSTKVSLDADGDAWGWNIGALFNVSPSTKVGISYRSEIEHELEGDLTSNNQLVAPNAAASADVTLPQTFILSTTQKLNNQWEMMGDISWTGWSSIQKIDIKRTGTTVQSLDAEFRDTWRVALGANYQMNSAWKLRGGLAWDQSPVRGASTRLVSLPDNDRVWLSAGAQWKASEASRLDFGLSYLIIGDTEIDNNQLAAGRGRVTGTYEGSVFIVGAQYSQAF